MVLMRVFDNHLEIDKHHVIYSNDIRHTSVDMGPKLEKDRDR